ncbi:unnamed protein product [Rotaria sp. Silwood1]|nr:unnamed protein product [Rotaria sp. Silwood1]CAF4704546.1 unnamed protein product [Rotaria sp. Silwood1]
MAQFRASHNISQQCPDGNSNTTILLAKNQLRKVDFIWVNQDYKSFEWFVKLLRQFELEQDAYLALNPKERRFLTIHLYFTEIKDNLNIGIAPLELITQVATADIFTGLKAQTHFGRPRWESIFSGFTKGEAGLTANDVNVFFCGPAIMGNTIHESCTKHGFHFYDEKF